MEVGFARLDITPCLGVRLAGSFTERRADGILDPLMATAVAFDNGTKRAVVLSVDILGIPRETMDEIRAQIAQKVETMPEAVIIACTHTHLAPTAFKTAKGDFLESEYMKFLTNKLIDVSALAFEDAAPSKMYYAQGKAEGVAFVRRYHMKDGTVCTNPPGYRNTNILSPTNDSDESVTNIIIKREGKPEIGIVNFQVHPDVIGGCKISADYPGFVRKTYEKLIDNSLCMYINGAQGDTNHIDAMHLVEGMCWNGYERSRYMGRKIAMAAVENYELAQELSGDNICFGQKDVMIPMNKGTEEEIEEAKIIVEQYKQGGIDAIVLPERYKGQKPSSVHAGACRILRLKNGPDAKNMRLTAVSVGEVVIVGLPGEPFTEIGCSVKERSKFTVTIPACCANGYEGYFPMDHCFDEGGYEALNANFARGTAERMIDSSLELISSL